MLWKIPKNESTQFSFKIEELMEELSSSSYSYNGRQSKVQRFSELETIEEDKPLSIQPTPSSDPATKIFKQAVNTTTRPDSPHHYSYENFVPTCILKDYLSSMEDQPTSYRYFRPPSSGNEGSSAK